MVYVPNLRDRMFRRQRFDTLLTFGVRTLCVHHLARQGSVIIVEGIIIIIIILACVVCSVVYWCTMVRARRSGGGLVLASAGPGPASPCQLPCGRHGCIAILLTGHLTNTLKDHLKGWVALSTYANQTLCIGVPISRLLTLG